MQTDRLDRKRWETHIALASFDPEMQNQGVSRATYRLSGAGGSTVRIVKQHMGADLCT